MVELIHFMWDNDYITTELGWNVLVLIPIINMDTWGIELLEVFWKVVKAVIYTQIKTVVHLHNFLHGFCAGRGTGTAIMEIIISHELSSVD